MFSSNPPHTHINPKTHVELHTPSCLHTHMHAHTLIKIPKYRVNKLTWKPLERKIRMVVKFRKLWVKFTETLWIRMFSYISFHPVPSSLSLCQEQHRTSCVTLSYTATPFYPHNTTQWVMNFTTFKTPTVFKSYPKLCSTGHSGLSKQGWTVLESM